MSPTLFNDNSDAELASNRFSIAFPEPSFPGDGGKAKAIPPNAIGPARFPGARLIEANRHDIS